MTRSFNAPRELVFEALTKPALVRRWLLGPPGCDHAGVRNRPPGRRRLSLSCGGMSTAGEMGMGGVFREIARPERLVNTQRFDTASCPARSC